MRPRRKEEPDGASTTRSIRPPRARPELRRRDVRRPGAAVRRLGHHRRGRGARASWTSASTPASRCSTRADVYSDGASEEVLGAAIEGRRDRVLHLDQDRRCRPATGPDDAGTSRARLIRAVEAALRRLGTDHIDLLQLHAFDAGTPSRRRWRRWTIWSGAGKVRYIGVSNFSGWQLMKSLAVAEQLGAPRYVAHQVYYSLVGRDYEWELMPLAHDQGIGAMVWSPLGWGRLTGQDPPRCLAAQRQPAARDRELRPPGRRRAAVRRRRRARRDRGGDRQGGPADRHQLAARAADRLLGDRRRAHRGAAAAEPRRGRLGADRRAAWRGSTP